MPHDESANFADHFTQGFWDDRYGSAQQLWSGRPNPQLVGQAAELTPGDALDVGCGEGADAIWLAAQGWTVTAVDISAVALDRAVGHAAVRGAEIAGRISWQQADLLSWDPGRQRYDLVSAQFMYLPLTHLESLHRRLAAAVRPGGTLLIVLHHPDGHLVGARQHQGPGLADSAEGRAVMALGAQPERLAAALDPGAFDVILAEAIPREMTDAAGRPVTLLDTVLRAVRRRAPDSSAVPS
ncbi:MAG TPA: methyltransferase domain-containing protein [Streptosporangiaceae bacterium]|nr:methyltransferase domain-containing protein [Streptosporangiaceae bacterium]